MAMHSDVLSLNGLDDVTAGDQSSSYFPCPSSALIRLTGPRDYITFDVGLIEILPLSRLANPNHWGRDLRGLTSEELSLLLQRQTILDAFATHSHSTCRPWGVSENPMGVLKRVSVGN